MTIREDDLARLREIAQKATRGPWHAGHLADDMSSCDCASILSETCMGAIATVHINNGLLISAGGNDAPMLEEAKANLRHIAAFSPSTVLALLDELTQARSAHKRKSASPPDGSRQ
jgi:Ead/Ea22-like protein